MSHSQELKNPLKIAQGTEQHVVVSAQGEPVIRPSGLDKIKVQGGTVLKGNIPISGAKNSALKLMCATLLTSEPVELTNLPVGLADIGTLSKVLNGLGVQLALRSDHVGLFHARDIAKPFAPYDLVRKMRASILVLGPLLARFGYAEVSLPGGCAIGTRPVDLHLMGMEAMGAEIKIEEGYVKAKAPKGGLIGADITFPIVSVGATENNLMAATLAKGTTRLMNAAREPEIVDLGNMLNKMGAKISGLGTDTITIEGVKSLHGTRHAVIADRIETGTWMVGAAMTGGNLILENTSLDILGAFIDPMRRAGLDIEQSGNDIHVARETKPLIGTDIMTEPYPGFPTDLQAQFMTMLTLCAGAGMVTETVFENRFMHVPELCRMGAHISVQGNSAIVRGATKLRGAEVMATDLRASASLVLAGLVAEGETTVNRIYHLDRGYENITEKLGNVGAKITRLSE